MERLQHFGGNAVYEANGDEIRLTLRGQIVTNLRKVSEVVNRQTWHGPGVEDGTGETILAEIVMHDLLERWAEPPDHRDVLNGLAQEIFLVCDQIDVGDVDADEDARRRDALRHDLFDAFDIPLPRLA